MVMGGDILTFLHLEMHATFKVMVLRRQDELVGPPQHGTIRIICFYELSHEFRAIERLKTKNAPPHFKNAHLS